MIFSRAANQFHASPGKQLFMHWQPSRTVIVMHVLLSVFVGLYEIHLIEFGSVALILA